MINQKNMEVLLGRMVCLHKRSFIIEGKLEKEECEEGEEQRFKIEFSGVHGERARIAFFAKEVEGIDLMEEIIMIVMK